MSRPSSPGDRLFGRPAAGQEESTPLKGSSDDDLDIVVAAGIKLPAMFLTRNRRWIALILFNVINSAASGPMTMFPALEPILVKEKVFEGPSQMGQLTTLYSITLGVVMTSMLPVGLLFDSYGPKFMAVVGTLMFTVFSILIGISIKFQSLNWLLYFVYPMGLMFGMGKSYGAYGYQWLLPESQNTVNSIINASQALSDALVLVCVWLHNVYGMQLWTYFWWLAILSVFTALLNSIIVPSRREHIGYGVAVTAFMEARVKDEALAAGYGSATSFNAAELVETEGLIKTSGWRWWDNIKGTCTTFRSFPVENFLFISGACTMYMFSWYPTMQMYPFYVGMFGAAEATRLVDIFALVYGVLGAVATIGAGRVVDYVGLKKGLILVNAVNLAAWGCLLIPSFSAQIAFQVCLTLSLNGVMIVLYRFCMLYAPMQLFGTYTGLVACIMGVFQVGCTAFATFVKTRVVKGAAVTNVTGGANRMVVFVQSLATIFVVLSITLWSMLLIYWRWYPLPEVGSVTCRQAGLPEESEYQEAEEADRSTARERVDSWL